MNRYISYWNDRAEKAKDAYEAVGAGQYLPGEKTIKHIQKSILKLLKKTNSTHCLDAGCGTGLYIPILLKHFHRVTGMDFSSTMIELAKKNLKEIKNVEFIVGSITEIPLKNNSLQNIFCKSTLQCLSLEDVNIALQEFKRTLLPGGNLLIHIKNSNNLGVSLSKIKYIIKLNLREYKALRKRFLPSNHREEFSPDKAFARPLALYFQLFREAGFQYIDMFSFQCYSLKYLHKKGIATRWEFMELLLRKLPLAKMLLKKQGIDCYILLKKV